MRETLFFLSSEKKETFQDLMEKITKRHKRRLSSYTSAKRGELAWAQNREYG